MPRDGRQPTEQDLLLAGTYNLGFIGVGNTRRGAAHARLVERAAGHRLASSTSRDGFFTDQKWIDFVPGLFDAHLVKDPSWNVAYWNLATRPLTRAEDGGCWWPGTR